MNSATAALHLALEALGIGADDRVLVPTWTFTATADAVRALGAHPVFVDVDPTTLNIDLVRLEEQILRLRREHGAKTKAVMPVHVGGQACEMDGIVTLACHHDLKIIEDAAHAFPTTAHSRSVSDAQRKQRSIGSIGHATAFSFYATKTIATGEGGMVTMDDERVAGRIRLMRLHGISNGAASHDCSSPPSWYYEVIAPGFKYNLTDVASSLGLVQLQRAQEFLDRRASIAKRYTAAFTDQPGLAAPLLRHAADVCSWHLYILRLNLDRITINREFARVVSLPIYPGLDDPAVDRVIEVALDVLSKFQR